MSEQLQGIKNVLYMRTYQGNPLSVPFDPEDIQWLIEQAEENKRLREALKFYADAHKWSQQHIENNRWTVPAIMHDKGLAARKALEGIE